MKQISKAAEPPSLTAHRKTKFADYQNYAAKDDLRQTLVAEQRGLCCYCVGRINVGLEKMRIEHWQSQSRFPAQQLNYRNLLGACSGGDGLPGGLQHCDTRKGNRDLSWNPAEPAHHVETRLRYELDGAVRANERAFDRQLNDVLNLNLPQIKNNRKSVLDALLEWWEAEKPVPKASIQSKIDERTNGALLAPYCQVAVWWLRQKLARMA